MTEPWRRPLKLKELISRSDPPLWNHHVMSGMAAVAVMLSSRYPLQEWFAG